MELTKTDFSIHHWPKGVGLTSEGYNYLSKNGDIWLYTGITSVNSDASNLRFLFSK